jgi:hypothetical protein
MDSQEKVEKVFKNCVEKILIYCITQRVDFRSSNTYDNNLNPDCIDQLINIYTDRYVKIYKKYFTYDLTEDKYRYVMNKFIRKIGIVRIMCDYNSDNIEKIIKDSIDKLRNSISNFDEEVGTCCFCQGECNYMSQSCGQCARGLSGIALGIPVPKHLEKFL